MANPKLDADLIRHAVRQSASMPNKQAWTWLQEHFRQTAPRGQMIAYRDATWALRYEALKKAA